MSEPPAAGRRPSCPKQHLSHPRLPRLPRVPQERTALSQRRQSPRHHCRTAGTTCPGTGQPGNGYRSGPVPSRGRTRGRRGRGRPADARVLALDQGQMGDDINNAIHWYKRNRGEWTRQLKNARAAQGGRGTQAGQAGGPGGQASPGIRAGRGGNGESPGMGQQHTGGPRGQVAVGRGAGRPAAATAPPDLRNVGETNGGRGLPGRPVHRGRPDSLRSGVVGKKNVPRIAERPGKGGRPRAATAAANPGGL